MDKSEKDFIIDFARNMGRFNNGVTNGNNRKHGINNNTNDVVKKVLGESYSDRGVPVDRNDIGTPSIPDDDTLLKPIDITDDMIKDITDFGEDTLLPEFSKNSVNVLGNPSQKKTNDEKDTQQYNTVQETDDQRQLMLDLDNIKVEHVYDQYDHMSKLLYKCLKELDDIKTTLKTLGLK